MGPRRTGAWRILAVCASLALLIAHAAHAEAPSFTGQSVRASGANTLVNLRGQGAIVGTAPMNVQVNAVRVGGILSPLISIVRSVLQPGAQATVCVEVQNLLGLDLTFLGVEVDVTAFNADSPNGVSGRIQLQTGIGGEDTSPLACADAVVLPPTANAGPDQNVADSDQQPGESIALNGSASSDPDGAVTSYQWFDSSNQQIATGANPTVRLADGQHTIRLVVTDNSGTTAVDSVNVTITAPSSNQVPIARAGNDRIVADTDRAPGERVTLDGSASTDPDGTIAQYDWLLGQSRVIATGVQPSVQLPDGPQTLTLRITDNSGATSVDSVTITVGAANPGTAPIANAGADLNISDTDNAPGETVTLTGAASSDPDGSITSYQWFLGDEVLATGVSPRVRIPDGESFVTLLVTDDEGNTASDGVLLTVSEAPVVPLLAALPGLTPNQLSVATTLDSLCPRLRARGATQQMTEGEADLLTRCNAITFSSSQVEQVNALDEISPQDLNATRTQTLNLARLDVAGIANRLSALRAGASGISVAGLNLNIDGKAVPVTQIAKSLGQLLGGGASADSADELLDARLGLWLRGNYSSGRKTGTIADHGFEADQWGLGAGADFRFSPRQIVGVALGYGRTRADFGRVDSGYLDTRAMSAALYATTYSQRGFYLDAIANYARSDHDSLRRIDFTEAGTNLDLSANGATQGSTVGLAFTVGYDFTPGAFTLAPSIGYNYLATSIDAFRERGAAGLDLQFDDQRYSSATANAGLRMSYAWKTAVGVLQPQIRGEYIRELINGTETFTARFANDPFDDTPRIVVTSDVADRSYWRLAGGLAAQFTHGIAGFVEYQTFESLRYVSYSDVAVGLRIETAFR